jgi:hypothetical protein
MLSTEQNTMFFLMGFQLIMAAQLWRARQRGEKTREQKRERKVDRRGRQSSKAEPEWKVCWSLREGVLLGEDPLPEELLFLTERDSGLNQSLGQKTWSRRNARWKLL